MERLDFNTNYNPIELAIHGVRYLPLANIVRNKRVLDIACGEGVGTRLIERWHAASVTGVDISKEAIDSCKKDQKEGSNARFILADACDFLETTDQTFDVIACVETIEHLLEPERFLALLKRFQDAGTTIMISCPNDHYYYGRGKTMNPYHVKAYSFYEFRAMAEAYLGNADWYLGAPSTGFTLFHERNMDGTAESYQQAIQTTNQGLEMMVPPSLKPVMRPMPSTALFYTGIWGGQDNKISYSMGFAASSDYRLPMFRNVSRNIAAGRTRRIAFVIDAKDWAFDNIVNNIAPSLEGKYTAERFYIRDYDDGMELFADLFLRNSFDNVHFMWREFWLNMLSKGPALNRLMKAHDLTPEELAEKLAHPAVSTTVYDHLFLTEDEIAERRLRYDFFDAYSTSSKKLQDIYTEHFPRPPAAETPDGVNTNFFTPGERHRFIGDDTFQIGWVGNSQWGNNSSLGTDPKGLNTILLPAVERLAAEGYPVVMDIADRNIRHRSKAEMVDYYRDLDVLVCASSHEGTPNPILEAMACGRAFVSTDVGIVAEVSGPLQKDYILRERTEQQMYLKLRALIENRHQLHELEAENLGRIQGWTWKSKIPSWTRLFAAAEEAHTEYGQSFRTHILAARLRQTAIELDATTLRQANSKLTAQLETQTKEVTRVSNQRDAFQEEFEASKKNVEQLREARQLLNRMDQFNVELESLRAKVTKLNTNEAKE